MNIVVYPSLCGLKIARGYLFGDLVAKCKIVSVELLIVKVTFFPARASHILGTAMIGLMGDPNWLIENAPSVRTAKHRAESKARARLEKEYSQRLEQLRKESMERYEEAARLRTENHVLRSAMKLVQPAPITAAAIAQRGEV